MASLASINYNVSEEQKCRFLQNPASYPSKPAHITMIETHVSYVFLVGAFAYKLKKPICNEYIDFRTLELRHYFCEEELWLNHRLAPNVYLGLIPITITTHSDLEFSGTGSVVDWLVKMRRLPAERMLDKMIASGLATQHDMVRISECLVQFYIKLSPVSISHTDWIHHFEKEIEQNKKILNHYPQLLPKSIILKLCAEQYHALTH